MSIRGNVFFLQRGELTITFDRWVAEHMPAFLHSGPAAVLERLTELEIVDTPMNEVWSEGAALVDVDRRRLLFFGGEPFAWQPWSRRVAHALLKAAWRGWAVALSHEGQSGILRALRHAAAESAAGDDQHFSVVRRIPVVTDPALANALVWIVGRGPVGVRFERKEWHLPTTIDVILARGVDAIDDLVRADLLDPPSTPIEARLFSGAWVDIATKTIRIWDHRARQHVRGRIAAALPGWSVEWQDGALDGALRSARVDATPWVVPVDEAIDEAWPKIDASYPYEHGMRRVAIRLVRDGHAPVSLLTKAGLRPEDVKPWLAKAVVGERIWKE